MTQINYLYIRFAEVLITLVCIGGIFSTVILLDIIEVQLHNSPEANPPRKTQLDNVVYDEA